VIGRVSSTFLMNRALALILALMIACKIMSSSDQHILTWYKNSVQCNLPHPPTHHQHCTNLAHFQTSKEFNMAIFKFGDVAKTCQIAKLKSSPIFLLIWYKAGNFKFRWKKLPIEIWMHSSVCSAVHKSITSQQSLIADDAVCVSSRLITEAR